MFASLRARGEMRREPRQVIGAHGVDAGIRQPDGVDHPAVELGDARRRRACARLEAHGLRDDPAERVEIDDAVELVAVAAVPAARTIGF